MIRLLVIDDHSVVRQGVRQILAGTPDIVVGADATNAADGLAQARADRFLASDNVSGAAASGATTQARPAP